MHVCAAAVSSCRGAFVCEQPCINGSTNVEAEARRHGSRGNTETKSEKLKGSCKRTLRGTTTGLPEGWTLTPHHISLPKMSWCSSLRGSKFRHVFGKAATREHSYDGVPITHSVHDNHYCSANPCFIAVVTECTAGGCFLVLPIHHTGRVVPQHPRVCGHRGRVLDIKWNPFDDYSIASCSEDCTVKIWDIPAFGLQQNLTKARKTLVAHSRRVAIIEWHPTAENLLLSSAYDYKVLLWDISQAGAVILHPVRVILMPVHHRYPSEALLLSVSFNSDGSRLAVTSKDRRVRVLDPRAGKILQVLESEECLFLCLSSWGSCSADVSASAGVQLEVPPRQQGFVHQRVEDAPVHGEFLMEAQTDGPLGCRGFIRAFIRGRSRRICRSPLPFLRPRHTHALPGWKGHCNHVYTFSAHITFICQRLYLQREWGERRSWLKVSSFSLVFVCVQGDGNIRFYELSAEKPFISFLNEYRSVLPQKGLGVMPKRGLDVMGCEVFRFYRLIAVKDLVGPLSMIVPRKKSEVFQEDLYPPTAGNHAAVTAREWLLGINRDPVLMSLNPEIKPENPYAEVSSANGRLRPIAFMLAPPAAVETGDQDIIELAFLEEQLSYQDAKYPEDDLSEWQPDGTQLPLWTHCCEPLETPPPPSDQELLQAFYRQQDRIRELRMELTQKEVRILQLELEIKNYRNHMRANF
ncbi:coronin-2A isoform X2 [Oryzias latipes]|uniref:coronin-2A isoform X2 n=1 Tax=Oryzias latipes TaxID=8090 RepID=UPI0009D97DB6|nr:coronin-2A isoform X2 [Oryzias latipes]